MKTKSNNAKFPRYTLKVLSVLVAIPLSWGSIHAETEFEDSDRYLRGARAMSLRYGYLNEANSLAAPGEFILDVHSSLDGAVVYGVESLIADKEENEKKAARFWLGIFIPGFYLYPRLEPGFMHAYHEYGHGSRQRAIGADPVYFFDDFDPVRLNAVFTYSGQLLSQGYSTEQVFNLAYGKSYGDFFSYAIAAVQRNPDYLGGFATVLKPHVGTSPNDWDFTVSAGGVNAEMYLTELIETRTYNYGGSFAYVWMYIESKLGSYRYFEAQDSTVSLNPDAGFFTGDMFNILQYYNEKRNYGNPTIADIFNKRYGYEITIETILLSGGVQSYVNSLTVVTEDEIITNTLTALRDGHKNYEIDRRDIETGNLISLFGSATTYLMFYSMYQYYQTGESMVRSFQYRGVRIPDINFYQTRRGISYKLSTGYRTGRWSFPIGIEKVIKGDQSLEVSPGVRYEFNDSALQAVLVLGRSGGLQLEYEKYFPLNESLQAKLGARLNYLSQQSLVGERLVSVADTGGGYDLSLDLYTSVMF